MDYSVIDELPPGRTPVKTVVISNSRRSEIVERINSVCSDGAQVYWVCTLIEESEALQCQNAEETWELLQEALADLKIGLIHGRLKSEEKEAIMAEFKSGEINLLVATTVIEVGVDVPNASLMIIENAERLGLAQLHQLRGRVGRSHHRAYAYLIIPPATLMTKDAVKRLEAVEAAGELGGGFMLSSHDMEIRGAGELLGEGQSGQIQEIGFTLYTELLERAVAALKSGKQPELDTPMDVGPEVDMQFPALIPADYLSDIHARLVLYKRIANASDNNDLRELQIEMIDRFGLLPEPVKNLFSVTELKQQAMVLGVKKIEVSAAGGRIVFNDDPAINTEQLISLIQTQSQCYKFDGARILKFEQVFATSIDKIDFVAELLNILRL
jgi:transcription-repair coupling factor (superfamily II helicase)